MLRVKACTDCGINFEEFNKTDRICKYCSDRNIVDYVNKRIEFILNKEGIYHDKKGKLCAQYADHAETAEFAEFARNADNAEYAEHAARADNFKVKNLQSYKSYKSYGSKSYKSYGPRSYKSSTRDKPNRCISISEKLDEIEEAENIMSNNLNAKPHPDEFYETEKIIKEIDEDITKYTKELKLVAAKPKLTSSQEFDAETLFDDAKCA